MLKKQHKIPQNLWQNGGITDLVYMVTPHIAWNVRSAVYRPLPKLLTPPSSDMAIDL